MDRKQALREKAAQLPTEPGVYLYKGADGSILELIDKMPDGKFENMADVMKGVGKSG